MKLALQIAMSIVGGYDGREHGIFTLGVSLLGGEDVLG